MSKQSKIIAAAFARLSQEDQTEAFKKIKELNDAPSYTKQSLASVIIKESMDLGPINTGACPYCGK